MAEIKRRSMHVAKVVLLWLIMLDLSHHLDGSDTNVVVAPNWGDKYSSWPIKTAILEAYSVKRTSTVV